jgi:hypothetical protein
VARAHVDSSIGERRVNLLRGLAREVDEAGLELQAAGLMDLAVAEPTL